MESLQTFLEGFFESRTLDSAWAFDRPEISGHQIFTLFDGLEIVPSFTILNSSSSSSSSFSFSFFLARQVTRNATWPSNEYVYDGGSRRKWDRGGEGRRKEREKRCLCNARGPVHPLRIYSWTREIFRDAVWKRWAANFSDGLSHGAWIRKFRVIKLESCF